MNVKNPCHCFEILSCWLSLMVNVWYSWRCFWLSGDVMVWRLSDERAPHGVAFLDWRCLFICVRTPRLLHCRSKWPQSVPGPHKWSSHVLIFLIEAFSVHSLSILLDRTNKHYSNKMKRIQDQIKKRKGMTREAQYYQFDIGIGR